MKKERRRLTIILVEIIKNKVQIREVIEIITLDRIE